MLEREERKLAISVVDTTFSAELHSVRDRLGARGRNEHRRAPCNTEEKSDKGYTASYARLSQPAIQIPSLLNE